MAASGPLLGVDYSEWLTLNATLITTDSSGALYIASAPPGGWSNYVTKLSSDGKTILWQHQFGFWVIAMAVDPSGGVYVIPMSMPGDTSTYVAKLSADGTGIAWETPVGFIAPSALGGQRPPVIAADSQGRAYVAASNDAANDQANVVRLNAAGTAVDYTTQVKGTVAGIAVDHSDAAFVAGFSVSQNDVKSFLARVAPDGSPGFYSTLPSQFISPGRIAFNANGDAVVFGAGVLQRVDSTGRNVFNDRSRRIERWAGSGRDRVHHGIHIPALPGQEQYCDVRMGRNKPGADCTCSRWFGPADHICARRPVFTVQPADGYGSEFDRLRGGHSRHRLRTHASRSVPGGGLRFDFPAAPLPECQRTGSSPDLYGEWCEPCGRGDRAGRDCHIVWSRARTPAGCSASSHRPEPLPNPGGRRGGNLRREVGTAVVGAGFPDQCCGTVVADTRAEHAGLRLLQQSSYELPDLAGGAVGSGGVHGGWQ